MANLTTNPTVQDFGEAAPGNTVSIIVNLANNPDFDGDTQDIVVSALTINNADFTDTDAVPFTILHFSNPTQITVKYTASGTPGASNGTLSVVHNGSNSPLVLTLTGTSTASGPLFSINPPSWNFGSQKTGVATAEKIFVVSNQGTSNLTITALNYNGDFSAGGTQPGLPATVTPGSTVNIGVKFTPSTAGFKDTTNGLSVVSNAVTSPDNVELMGTGFLITPAFTVRGVQQSLIALKGATPVVDVIDPTTLNSEEISTFNRVYDFGSLQTWNVIRSVYIYYEDIGPATIIFTAQSPNQTVTVNVPIGTGAADGTLRFAVSPELLVDGPVIFLQWQRAANSGPVQIVALVEWFFEDEQVQGTFTVPKALTPAFINTGTLQTLVAFGNTVQSIDPTNLASEKTSSLIRVFDYNPEPGYENSLLRVFFHYEDLGIASLTVTATIRRYQASTNTTTLQSVPVTLSIGTAAADSSALDAYADLEISGELISVEVDRTAGAVSVLSMTHRFIPRGEEIPA